MVTQATCNQTAAELDEPICKTVLIRPPHDPHMQATTRGAGPELKALEQNRLAAFS